MKTTIEQVLATAVMTVISLTAAPGRIPALLPAPDGKPGDAIKPVKVYILAGQSNIPAIGPLSVWV